MRILVCPDKFKGSLSAIEACEAIKDGVTQVFPKAQIRLVPMADGGEGSLEALAQVLPLTRQTVQVLDPLFRSIQSTYGFVANDAHIEMAQASGLDLLSKEEQTPLHTSTYGTGQLIADAMNKGAGKIYLWVGGSATNDGGMGVAKALGFRFRDSQGKELSPTGENLIKIVLIEAPNTLPTIPIELLTDVTNTLTGQQGAAHVFAAQKGASAEDIILLDKGLENLARVIQKQTGRDIENMPGIGAAGGIGAVLAGYMNVEIQSGIATLMDLYRFKDLVLDIDLVITGEGKVDQQTLKGKVVAGVAREALKAQVPVWVLCGRLDLHPPEIQQLQVQRVISLQNASRSSDYCVTHAAELLTTDTAEALATTGIDFW